MHGADLCKQGSLHQCTGIAIISLPTVFKGTSLTIIMIMMEIFIFKSRKKKNSEQPFLMLCIAKCYLVRDL